MRRVFGGIALGVLLFSAACASILDLNANYELVDDAGLDAEAASTIDGAPSTRDGAPSLDGGDATTKSDALGSSNSADVAVDSYVNTFDSAGLYTVGGTVTGLGGGDVVLVENGVNDLTVSANGAFTFTSPSAYLPLGATYNVAIATQPTYPSPTCTVTNGSGTIGDASVTNVQVTCSYPGCTSNVTTLTTCTELAALPASATGTYALGGDIDCSASSGWNAGAGFIPLQNFSGCILGNHHVVSGLTINSTNTMTTSVGLIGTTGGTATIVDLGVVNANVTGAGSAVGILAGSATNATIARCYTSGSVSNTLTNTSNSSFTGGLMGTIASGIVVQDCYSTASVSGAIDYTGGLIGAANPGVVIERTYATGAVTTKLSGARNAGLVTYSWSNLSDSFSTSSATNGLCITDFATVTNSFFTGGATSGTCGTYEAAGAAYFQGTGISTKAPFTAWDFTNVWQAVAGGYPTLR